MKLLTIHDTISCVSKLIVEPDPKKKDPNSRDSNSLFSRKQGISSAVQFLKSCLNLHSGYPFSKCAYMLINIQNGIWQQSVFTPVASKLERLTKGQA